MDLRSNLFFNQANSFSREQHDVMSTRLSLDVTGIHKTVTRTQRNAFPVKLPMEECTFLATGPDECNRTTRPTCRNSIINTSMRNVSI